MKGNKTYLEDRIIDVSAQHDVQSHQSAGYTTVTVHTTVYSHGAIIFMLERPDGSRYNKVAPFVAECTQTANTIRNMLPELNKRHKEQALYD